MFKYSVFPQEKINSDLIILLHPEEEIFQSEDHLPEQSRIIKNVYDRKDFKGKYKENIILYPSPESKIHRILLIGIGKINDLNSEKSREIGFFIGKKQIDLKVKLVHIFIDKNLDNSIFAIAEGILYSRYVFKEYKTEKEEKTVKAEFNFLGSEIKSAKEYKDKFRRILSITEGINFARNLANIPANHLTPNILKKKVRSEFKNYKQIKIETLNKEKLAEKRFRLLLSVAQGSKQDPCLIILRHQPSKSNGKRIAIVGKGVTFDSGGISIKPSANMDEMKFDMAGAAATIGILKTAALLKPETELIGIIPAVENMPGGNAIKPGDIIKAYNGKTVEILNTDAEGRLILADALAYGIKRFKPDLVIDFATLTGSIVAALGDKMAGMFTNSSEIGDIFKIAGERSGDMVWPMPLLDSYSKLLESKYADIANIGGRWGGAITAAKFLENFVSENKWIHFDIAGTANDVKNVDYLSEGATGYGPRLFFEALSDLEKIL